MPLAHRKISAAVWVCLTIALPPTCRAERVTAGPFALEVPAGWERAPANIEASAEAWLLLQKKMPSATAGAVVVAFSRHTAPAKDEAERNAYLKRFRDGQKARHPAGFRLDRMRVASVDAERVAYNNGGSTVFNLSPYNGERVFLIVVQVPGENARFPDDAAALLKTLAISGPPPPKKKGFLDRLSDELDKVSQGLDSVLGSLGGKKTETSAQKPPDTAGPSGPGSAASGEAPAGTGGASGKETSPDTPVDQPPDRTSGVKVEAGTGVKVDTSAATGTKLDTAASNIYISVSPDFKVTSTGLAATDRAWGAGAAVGTVKPAVAGPPQVMPAPLDVSWLARTQFAGGASAALAALRERLLRQAEPAAPRDARPACRRRDGRHGVRRGLE